MYKLYPQAEHRGSVKRVKICNWQLEQVASPMGRCWFDWQRGHCMWRCVISTDGAIGSCVRRFNTVRTIKAILPQAATMAAAPAARTRACSSSILFITASIAQVPASSDEAMVSHLSHC